MSNLKVEREKHGNSKVGAGGKKSEGEAGWLSQRRAERNANRGASDTIGWGDADAVGILSLIDQLTQRRATVTFATTRDGGAIKFSIYDGSERVDEYCRPTESIETFIAMLTELYASD